MITSNTTLRQLFDMTAALEKEHGELQGIILHRNATGRCFYRWKTFSFTAELAPEPPVEAPKPPKLAVEPEIPLPPPMSVVKGGPWHDQFAGMAAGQSFTVQTKKDLVAALTAGKRMGIKPTSRKLTTGGWRIWRTQ